MVRSSGPAHAAPRDSAAESAGFGERPTPPGGQVAGPLPARPWVSSRAGYGPPQTPSAFSPIWRLTRSAKGRGWRLAMACTPPPGLPRAPAVVAPGVDLPGGGDGRQGGQDRNHGPSAWISSTASRASASRGSGRDTSDHVAGNQGESPRATPDAGGIIPDTMSPGEAGLVLGPHQPPHPVAQGLRHRRLLPA